MLQVELVRHSAGEGLAWESFLWSFMILWILMIS